MMLWELIGLLGASAGAQFSWKSLRKVMNSPADLEYVGQMQELQTRRTEVNAQRSVA